MTLDEAYRMAKSSMFNKQPTADDSEIILGGDIFHYCVALTEENCGPVLEMVQ